VVELLGMSLWFTASAVTPHLQTAWGLSAGQAGWLTTVVQLGFVAGTATAALLNLADIWSARWLVGVSCILGASANALVVATDNYAFALGMRFLTGFFLAGVYPPAMKMIATWFVANRGLAIGSIVGALTLGKALPFLLRALEGVSASAVVLSASIAALFAAVLVIQFYRDGPHSFERRPFSWSLIGTVVRHRETRLAILGYLGHMWELYAMWSLIAIFTRSAFIAFLVIGTGAIGSVLAGKWADRVGRERVTIISMLISGACALSIGWITSSQLVMVVALIWGFSIVADSAQFSAIVTEVAPKHAVGTALTLQTSLGFLLTAFTIWFAIRLHAVYDWRVAFGMLAVGPALGIIAMLRLKALRATS
jgi:MFS family permease